jgi:Baseplate J-like protein
MTIVDDLVCRDHRRRADVRDGGALNGIDYVEVLPSQRTLLIHCFLPVTALTVANVRFEGGVRVRNVRALWAFDATNVPPGFLTPDEAAVIAGLPLRTRPSQQDHVLVVRTSSSGDFSTYTIAFVASPTNITLPAPGFDDLLNRQTFSFKVDCPSDFDCRTVDTCVDHAPPAPQIDYLAKDYASFRRLMLDRLAVLMPDWRERNAADVGIALVELLAYSADRLSYFQDAAATEAYLGTARRRTSVRRHARLVDYPVHEGANARAWICFEVKKSGDADGATLEAGTPILTRQPDEAPTIAPARVGQAAALGSAVFETLHDVTLSWDRNEIPFYTWGDEECCLPRGSTRATLVGTLAALRLRKGDVLVLEEVLGAETGKPEDTDRTHRHAVRLSTKPTERVDPLTTAHVVEVEWQLQDALPFPLCAREFADDAGNPKVAAVARGNVALADHGRTIEETLPVVPRSGVFRPELERPYVTQAMGYDDRDAREQPAVEALRTDFRKVLPAAKLFAGGEGWRAQRELLNSDRFANDFVVEVEDDGRASLRFGDGILGRKPMPETEFLAVYRIGTGRVGNVGAEALACVATTLNDVTSVRNPIAAAGGAEAEPIDQVRLYAPQAFRKQERAVTEADYADVAERHPEVQKAAATKRWTRSWYTMFVTADRLGGRPVDEAFEDQLRTFLDGYRLAGVDVEIDAPRFVALELELTVCVSPGYVAADVERALLDALSNRDLPDGSRGFFHPDNFSFGQPVYLSGLIAAAMAVPGVDWVDVTTFERRGQPSTSGLDSGRLTFARLEIARLDNDPNFPEDGRLKLDMEGGA